MQTLVWDVRAPRAPVLVVSQDRSSDGQPSRGMVTSLLLRSDLSPKHSSDEENAQQEHSRVFGIIAGFEDGSICVHDMRNCG